MKYFSLQSVESTQIGFNISKVLYYKIIYRPMPENMLFDWRLWRVFGIFSELAFTHWRQNGGSVILARSGWIKIKKSYKSCVLEVAFDCEHHPAQGILLTGFELESR